MSILTDEIKTFIVKGLARYDSPTRVAEAVRAEFGVQISRQQVHAYDPDCSKPPAQRWCDLHAATRAAFLRDVSSIGIAHKAVRLRKLEQFAQYAEEYNYFVRAAALLQQAARECGGFYERRGSMARDIAELRTETPAEAPPEPRPQTLRAAPEVVPEVAPEVVLEVVPEVAAEVAAEAMPEVAPAVVPEVVPEVVPDVVPEVVPDVAPEVVPTVVPGAVPEVAAGAASAVREPDRAPHRIRHGAADAPQPPGADAATGAATPARHSPLDLDRVRANRLAAILGLTGAPGTGAPPASSP